MSYVESHIDKVGSEPRIRTVSPPRTGTSVFQCLILSASQSRREALSRAAIEGGWDAVVCADAAAALAEARRSVFRLALVDLDGGCPTPADFRDVCEQLPGTGELLMAVCGHEAKPAEEIWARQLGAWVYLPGLAVEDDVAPLFGEARKVAKQLLDAKQPQKKRSSRAKS